MERRELLIGTGAALLLASCGTNTNPSDWVSSLLTTLQNIQAQVRTRLAGICATANSMVPTIDTALEALKAALNLTSIGASTTIPITAVESAINGIVAFGCPPAPAPSPAPPAPTAVAPPTVKINGKDVPVSFV